MKLSSSVVSHFTHSVDRYTQQPPLPDDFAMRAFSSSKDDLRVLELGCGTGHRLEGLMRLHPGFHLYGLDITPVMVRAARQVRPASIAFMVGNCLNAPFSKGQFDAIILYDVLHHLIADSREKSILLRTSALQELLRLLAPGGRIILEEVCVNAAWREKLIYSFSIAFSRLHLHIPFLHIHSDVVLNFYTIDEFHRDLELNGFQVEDQEMTCFSGLGAFISTFGDRTYHVRSVLSHP